MTTAANVLKRFYDAESRYVSAGCEDFGPIAETLHPEVVIVQADSLPFGGEWRGHDGFESWMRAFGEAWSSAEAHDVRLVEDGDTVVVLATMEATARATGRSVRAPICHAVRVRDGLLAEFRVFYWDTAATIQALGAPASPMVALRAPSRAL